MIQPITRWLVKGLLTTLVLGCEKSPHSLDFTPTGPCQTFLSDSLWSFSLNICNVSMIYNEGGYYPNIRYRFDYVENADTNAIIIKPLIVTDTSVHKFWYMQRPTVQEFHDNFALQWFISYGMINSDSLEIEVIEQADKTVIIGSYKNSILALIRSEESFPVIIRTSDKQQPSNFRKIIFSFNGRKNDPSRIITYRPEWRGNY